MFNFRLEHHNRIAKVLSSLSQDFLDDVDCYFAGGTAIVMMLSEYRESVDIDFLCSSREGYSKLCSALYGVDFSPLFASPIPTIGEIRKDQYGVRGRIDVDGIPIRLEFVSESRLDLSFGARILGVPTLGKVDLFAAKLLANADRGLDKASQSKDLIDLGMMQFEWDVFPLKLGIKRVLHMGLRLTELTILLFKC
ncbi:nucleotidyl transferase AbiEii/AbiGii toxin family protein [Photorhabdus heterorhabditis]|uniref:nucleotidyl transferase AbiEii/AbiGii toxin family protein n=1 Tax=Photorhabdus heterorhabditis TaxID=880156 RepID=UPI001561BF7F|nr:nucleotidyl transferase AbiEii/AbiGii toxin family protein [Photorhabdus heterorhabditis]NRN29659.1 nucleotidyl transferase AbiEii/AbiGii toxin family protein [Photorhabdus heterorhabditis subsp. aluminescens]